MPAVRLTSLSLLLSSALILGLPALAADQAGVSAAVRGQVALTRQQLVVGRQVVGGEPILLEDAIKSGQRSGMQILLLDETVFTIGPESELVIDEFVYDPKTNAGKLSAEVTKGVFRFVSGKIAHEKPEDMNVKLPSGTLGVRGTMVAGRVGATQKSSRLVLLGEGPENDTGAPAGAFIACNAGTCVRINRPGFGTSIDGPDSPPVAPFRFAQEELDALTRSVSDPDGSVETATAGDGATPGVAAGPGDGGAEGADTRSATEISGITTAGGARNGDTVLARLGTLDGLVQATAEASQFSTPTVLVNGRPVELSTDCVDFSSCGLGLYGPSLLFADITTYDQLSALATSGLQTAVYQRSGLSLLNTNGQVDGSYDFSLYVFLGSQSADLQISNLDSSLLGLDAVSFGAVTDFSSYPLGYNVPMSFVATATVNGVGGGPCGNGCDAAATAMLQNTNGRLADTALQAVVIVSPPDPTTGAVTGAVSENPYAPISRP